MIIPRGKYKEALLLALSEAPAVVLLGPRQVGKTTLARQLCDDFNGQYFDLERSADLRMLSDTGEFLQLTTGKLTVIDEVHRAPELFRELRGAIDE
jgi:uncharacterized protein